MVVTSLAASSSDEKLADIAWSEELAKKIVTLFKHDRNVSRNTTKDTNVLFFGVLYEGEKDRGFAQLLKKSVQSIDTTSSLKKGIRVVLLRFKSPLHLKDVQLERHSYTGLFISHRLKNKISSIIQLTQHKNVTTFSDNAQLVERGVSVGVIKDGEHQKLFINLKSAKAEKFDLPSRFLGLAKTF